MSEHPADIESALTTALRERCEAYVRARESLTELERRLNAGETPLHAVCPELHNILESIRVADDSLAPLQQRWGRLSVRPGAVLAELIQHHQSQLEQTLTVVDRLTTTARKDREQLAPKLDEVARGRRMQAAYAASGSY